MAETAGSERAERPELPAAFRPIILPVALAAVMWVVEVVDLLPHTNFDRWGIRPRTFKGLFGIIWAPFLHNGFGHLIGNTIPFLVLGAVIALSGAAVYLEVTALIALVSGLGVWLIADGNTITFGASGIVFGYITYLIGRGFYAKRAVYLVGGVVVAMVYGTVLWGALPGPTGISWQGHLFGALGGVLAAKVLHEQKKDEDLAAKKAGKAPKDPKAEFGF